MTLITSRAPADVGHAFLIDIHKSFVIYEVDPQPSVPESSSKGRKVSRLMTGQKSVSAEEFVESCSTEHWRVHHVRETTRGSLKLRVLGKSVYVWDNQSEQARRYDLLVTENLDGQDRKYSLTNQKPSTSTRRLSWMQRQRYWVERCFEDGKGQCGMADYQVRRAGGNLRLLSQTKHFRSFWGAWRTLVKFQISSKLLCQIIRKVTEKA